ncbi:MAG: phenylalanine--tRNA ligase subunit alpha [Proteobacteria bacterium]|nr:phenylalanine--tRNA ligase subunit alpha [Pseudomonadota bacterium]
MLDEIARIKRQAESELAAVSDVASAEACRVRFLGRRGLITSVLKSLRDVPSEVRPEVGREINTAKSMVESRLSGLISSLGRAEVEGAMDKQRIDITLPARGARRGREHPLRKAMAEVLSIFTDLGFSVHEGPEIETDYYNFEALGVPADHPAREMQDTFYVEGGRLLRTHTSPVQIRVMESKRPPICAVFPGAVFRRDNDVSHSPMFHQVEGLMVDRRITMGDLKGVLSAFCRRMFGTSVGVRFRPSYFPFTEPSAEVDIRCVMCGGAGCRVCKQTGWIEILGCGMVDPVVFGHVKIDPKAYTGFAFGMGVERIAMLKYAIGDIRLFFENDLRFLEQF